MRRYRTTFAIAFAMIAASCTDVGEEIRGLVAEDRIQSRVNVVRHDVIVPEELTVSEANLYYPGADIVWRDDPPGDRHKQIGALIDSALDWGLAAFDRGQTAVVTLEVKRFHALTEKARYSVGGVHAMQFHLLVWDLNTGNPIYGPVEVNANLKALGGDTAIDADRMGRTQKVRIRQHIAGKIQQELLAAGLGQAVIDGR